MAMPIAILENPRERTFRKPIQKVANMIEENHKAVEKFAISVEQKVDVFSTDTIT